MTAAFDATYSDWKLIRSRKVVQLVLEVPIEAADKAYQVLGGMPNPAGEIWVAVARLNTDRAPHPAPEQGEVSSSTVAPTTALPPRRFTSLPLPQQAVLLCKDARFHVFVQRHYSNRRLPHTEEAVTAWLKMQAGISSRRELQPDTDGGEWFIRVRDRYLAWKLAPAICGSD